MTPIARRAPIPPANCSAHPERAVAARCRACGARMCGACFRFVVDERPSCAKCAFVERTRTQRRASLAVSFVLLTWGAGLGLWRAAMLDLALVVIAGVTAILLAGLVWVATRPAAAPVVRALEEEEAELVEEPLAPAAHPYRARARRAALAAAPRVSGTATVLVVLAAFAFCGVAIPASLRTSLWIELEIALGGAWLALSVVLATLLYRGYRLRDDFMFVGPWEHFHGGGGGSSPGCDGCSADGEGLVIALLLVVALAAAVLLVELLVPLVFVLVYVVIMKALTTVAHDRHDCRGALARSAGWGAAWAFLFVWPLAAVVLGIQALR